MKCEYCKKSLVSIGNKRSNGKCVVDFKNRRLHSKCYKNIMETIRMLEYLKRHNKDDSIDYDKKINDLTSIL